MTTSVTIIENDINVTVDENVTATIIEDVATIVVDDDIATITVTENDTTVTVVDEVDITVDEDITTLSITDGITDHNQLNNLDQGDPHPQYLTNIEGDTLYWPIASDLATQVELDAEITARSTADTTLNTAITNHAGGGDPHTQYVLAAGDTMTGPLQGYVPVNTKVALQAGSWADNTILFASDTRDCLIKIGGFWYKIPLFFKIDSPTPDMGYTQLSGISGITDTYITDHTLHNCQVLGSAITANGSIRTQSGTFQVYLNGVWNDIPFNFRLREDSTEGYEFEHKPVGFTEWIEIMSGNGNTKGLNGLPLVQQYSVSIGAYPVQQTIDGGAF